MREGIEQFRLPDTVLRHVGECDPRPESRSREEARPQRALLVQGQRHPGLRPREVDQIEKLGRCGRNALGGRAEPHLDHRLPRLADVAVVERPVAAVGDPLRTAADQQHGIGDGPRGRGGDLRRTGRKVGPHRAGHAVAGVGQAVLRPGEVIENQRAVGEIRRNGLAEVSVPVGQLEPELGPGAEIHRIEALEPRPRDDAVGGGVFQAVFEPDADLRRRREDDLAVVRRETVAVVEKSVDRLAVGVDALGRGRVDDVAHGVGDGLGVGRNPPQFVRRSRRRSQPPRREAHAAGRRRGVARGVGPAHVERPEKRRFEKAALHLVIRLPKNLPDERGDVQERMVVLHREQAFRRKQVRGAVLPTVFVAVDGEELHRGVVRPALDDRRRGQDIVPRHPQSGEHAAGGIFGPSGPSVADFERVPLSRRGQQAHRSADQRRTFGRQLRRVERVVEPAGGVRIAGKPHERIVARRRGNRDFQRPPFAASLRIGEPCGIVAGNGNAPRLQVANLSVDFQFHAACFLRLGRMAISRQLNVPRRCTTASSVAMSTGI